MGIEPEDNPKDEEVRTETYSLDFHLMTQASRVETVEFKLLRMIGLICASSIHQVVVSCQYMYLEPV